MNKAQKLRRPEFELHFLSRSINRYDAENAFDIRRPFKPYIVQNPIEWRVNPYQDKTWQLYYHSLYWLGVLCFGIDTFENHDPERADRYRKTMYDIVTSYVDFILDENSFPDAVWDDHAVSYRASYIAYCYEAHLAPLFTAEQNRRLRVFVRTHTDKLIEFIQSDRWRLSNHTLFQIEGLADTSFIFFDELEYGRKNLTLARDTLCSFIKRIISSKDGTTKEHALFYHAFLMARIRDCSEYLANIGYPVDMNLTRLFRKMNTFLWTVMPYEAHIPAIGDTKFDMTVDKKYIEPFYSIDYSSEITKFIRYKGAEGGKLSSLSVFREDGYYVFRKGLLKDAELFSIFLEKTYIGPHGHIDGNSFISYYGGEPFLIDSGGPFKYGHPLRYQYFQSQLAHNTVLFDKPVRYLSAVKQIYRSPNADLVVGGVSFEAGHQWLRVFGRAYRNVVLVLDLAVPADPHVHVAVRYHLSPHLKITQPTLEGYWLFGDCHSATAQFFSCSPILTAERVRSTGHDTSKKRNAAYFPNPHAENVAPLITREDTKFERSHMICRDIHAWVPHLGVFCFDRFRAVGINQRGKELDIRISDGQERPPLVITIIFETTSAGVVSCTVKEKKEAAT